MQNDILHDMRHSSEHVLAEAMYKLYPGVKMAMGPATDDGFYGDFELPEGSVISIDDLPKIEEEMQKIIAAKAPIVRKEISVDEARKLFPDNPYKQEWLDEIEARGEQVSVYWTGDSFVDLCAGPHVASTGDIKAVKLLSVAGAYWRGNSKNKMLTRIYGTAFASPKELREHLKMLEEAEKRDHRKIGKALELFYFDPSAPGAPYMLPKGLKIINILKDFWRQYHERRGYQEISAPILNNKYLWEISGHWDHYRENMFLVKEDDDTIYGLKPMNCPNAMVLFNLKTRSYQDLPLRFSDVDTLHRNEASGALMGLFRVRQFQQDDAHIFITEDQIEEEYKRIFDIADYFYKVFGIQCEFKLSTRPDDFMGDPKVWDKAETILKNILDERVGEGNYEIKEKDGAFYGPKVDIHMKDCMGREWQTGTAQLDFQLAGRFGCQYADKDGQLKTPVVIHRVIYGSLERFLGILIENFAGAFPVWIAPVQVKVLPVSDKHREYATKITEELLDAGIRAEMDNKSNTIGYQIREAHNQKIPYAIIIGDKEVEAGNISVRDRKNTQKNAIPLADFIANVKEINDTKSLELWK